MLGDEFATNPTGDLMIVRETELPPGAKQHGAARP